MSRQQKRMSRRFLANVEALAKAFDAALATEFATNSRRAQEESMRAALDAGFLERVDADTMQFTDLLAELSADDVVRRGIAALRAGRQ